MSGLHSHSFVPITAFAIRRNTLRRQTSTGCGTAADMVLVSGVIHMRPGKDQRQVMFNYRMNKTDAL